MRLLERYLKAVESYLPVAQPKDIIRELEENIQAQMDDEAARRGRPLTEEEQAAILKLVGNPALVAGRYHNSELSVAFGRQLVGPGLFPLYARVLSITLVSAAAVRMLVGLWLGQPPIGAMIQGLLILVWPFAIVTAVFAGIQSVLTKNPALWNAWDPLAPPTRLSNAQWVSRLEALLEIGIVAAALLWLRSDFMGALLANLTRLLPPVWPQIYGLAVALTAAGLAPAVLSLLWPRAERLRLVVRVTLGLAWVVGLSSLLAAGDWGISTATAFNQYVWYSVLALAVVSAVVVMVDATRLLRRRGPEPRAEAR